MLKNILKIAAILILGAIGGILFQIVILPYLFTSPYFEKFQFIKILKEREVVINPKEEIIIRENIALEKAVEKAEKAVVGIQTKTSSGKILEGSGLIVSSDGLVVTLAELLPADADFSFFAGEEKIPGKILKRDLKQNLVLVSFNKTNLPTNSFADFKNIKLGERVFLIGIIPPSIKRGGSQKIVNEGIIKTFNEDSIKTNIFEKEIIKGSPLFDIEGNILGLNQIDKDGEVTAIPVQKIKSFAGF